MKKHDVKNINLQIDRMRPFSNPKYVGFTIDWSSNIGFGQYTIYRKALPYDIDKYDDTIETEKWFADAETMDSNDDKEFIQELMRLFIEKLRIT